jgi:hypothetical protein
MTITNISVVGIPPWTGAATPSCIYRVAAPVRGGIPKIEIFLLAI